MMDITLTGKALTLEQLREAWLGPINVSISDGVRERTAASNAVIAEVLARGEQVYGVNTGFGLLANVSISEDELEHLQDNLIRSHAVGVGKALPDEVVRLVMLMKIEALTKGHSGVRPE